MIKILVTGENGFIGRNLTNLLKSRSFEIIEIGDINNINLCDWDSVRNIAKSEIIIHLASKTFVPESFNQALYYYNNNITSTLNILEKAKLDRSKVIFFSTYVYGIPQYLPIDENHIICALNPYTQSKLICEQLCVAYNRDFGVPITIFRPFNIYGPGQNPPFFIPTIINQLNNEFIQLGDSRPRRDFVFVDDVIEAVYQSIIINDNTFKIYNLGSGVSISVKEIANLIINISQSKAKIKFSEQIRQGEILDTIADISKIKNELCWQPKITLDKGINLCLDHIKNKNLFK